MRACVRMQCATMNIEKFLTENEDATEEMLKEHYPKAKIFRVLDFYLKSVFIQLNSRKFVYAYDHKNGEFCNPADPGLLLIEGECKMGEIDVYKVFYYKAETGKSYTDIDDVMTNCESSNDHCFFDHEFLLKHFGTDRIFFKQACIRTYKDPVRIIDKLLS